MFVMRCMLAGCRNVGAGGIGCAGNNVAECIGGLRVDLRRCGRHQELGQQRDELNAPCRKTSAAKECSAPGGGDGKGAARLTRATLSTSRSVSPLDRSRTTETTPRVVENKANHRDPSGTSLDRGFGIMLDPRQKAKNDDLIAHRFSAAFAW